MVNSGGGFVKEAKSELGNLEDGVGEMEQARVGGTMKTYLGQFVTEKGDRCLQV